MQRGAHSRPATTLPHDELRAWTLRRQRLALVAEILISRGQKLVEPSARKGVHPFVVPISVDETTGTVMDKPLWLAVAYQHAPSTAERPLALRTTGRNAVR
jgi:hypothetical protein